VFARKVIYSHEVRNINNETRVIQKLRDNGGHINIIEVLNHGWLPNNEYYIDTEICVFSLRDFLKSDLQSALGSRDYFCRRDCPDGLGCLRFWNIAKQVTRGLEFIHNSGELHRDIKPENGKS
jgi:serine/threonine protein kinase